MSWFKFLNLSGIMNWVTNSLNLCLRSPSSVSLSVLKAALQCCEREGPGIKTWLTEWASDKVTFGAVLWSWKWIESCKSSNRSSLKRKSFPNARRTWVLSAIVNETAWTAFKVVNRLGWNFDQTIHKPWSNCEQLWSRREICHERRLCKTGLWLTYPFCVISKTDNGQ